MSTIPEKPGPGIVGATTLLVKKLPLHITESNTACHQFFAPFGTIDVRLMCSKSMKGSAFIDFPDNTTATRAREHLLHMDFNGKKLKVEYATPSRDTINRNISAQPILKHPAAAKASSIASFPPSEAQNRRMKANLNTKRAIDGFDIASPIAPHLGIKYPSNPNLHYRYPDPTPEILTNIMHAIGTVPRLYNQVLHLMNKMNLPPPFGPVRRDATPAVLKRKADDLVASDESEIESSGDESKRTMEKQTIQPVSKRRQLATGQKKSSTIQINISKPNPAIETPENAKDHFSSPHIKLDIEPGVHIGNDTGETVEQKAKDMDMETAPSNALEEHHQAKQDVTKENENYVSMEELNARKAAPDDPQYNNAFKNYFEGQPTNRLYIKNLERKIVKEADLRRIFGRFVVDNQGDPKTDLDINLLLTGRMRGQAFVTFRDEELAKKALDGAHRYILHDKPLVIQFAKSKQEPS
ncbi:hypothetical protein NQZ79_g4441 [Umbelopsis isabellina]|nr:hypothetical protein NQZ79_g4441 [Umbelopsis isabellina]